MPDQTWKPGVALNSYICKSHQMYDSKFAEEMRRRHPDWFDTADKNKALLIALAKGKRPARGTPLGDRLCSYTNKSSGCYDRDFDVTIRDAHPEWFVNTSNEKKKALLGMPVGCERPRARDRHRGEPKTELNALGDALVRYTNKSSEAYDSKFDALIRERQPHWFYDTVAEKKKALLALPVGCKKPAVETELGSALFCYMNKLRQVYDPKFSALMRERQPSWFDRTLGKKQELLNMPSGCARPRAVTRLGSRLKRYVRQYPAFSKAIRDAHPQWFWRAKRA